MRILRLLIIFQLITVLHVIAQTAPEKTAKRMERLRKIDYMHLGMGVETGGNENWFVSPKVFYGIGSYRNILNADIGICYQLTNLLGSYSNERIMLQQLPVFANLHLNIMRWNKGSMYIGGEVAYYLAVKGDHHIPLSDITENENSLGKSHATAAGSLGVRLSHWDFGLYYVYDLSPSMNQKFVFESADYDYDYLCPSLFERSRFAFSVSYLLPL